MTESLDHDYDLPKEELTSSAVYPPMLSLKLENCQGYPRTINVDAFSDVRGADITVQDVLRTIHEDLKIPFSKRELNKLGVEERTAIRTAFKERCRSDDDLSKGPRRIDHLGGRDRLQILPRLPPEGGLLTPTPPPPAEFLCVDRLSRGPVSFLAHLT